MPYVDVREPNSGKLLLQYDPDRDIIQVQRRGVLTTVDLRRLREEQQRRENDRKAARKKPTAE